MTSAERLLAALTGKADQYGPILEKLIAELDDLQRKAHAASALLRVLLEASKPVYQSDLKDAQNVAKVGDGGQEKC